MSWCEATLKTEPTITLAQYLRRHHVPKKTWRGRRCTECGKSWRRHGCRDYLWATDYLSRLSRIILFDRPDRPKSGRHRPSYTQPLREYADIADQHVAAQIAAATSSVWPVRKGRTTRATSTGRVQDSPASTTRSSRVPRPSRQPRQGPSPVTSPDEAAPVPEGAKVPTEVPAPVGGASVSVAHAAPRHTKPRHAVPMPVSAPMSSTAATGDCASGLTDATSAGDSVLSGQIPAAQDSAKAPVRSAAAIGSGLGAMPSSSGIPTGPGPDSARRVSLGGTEGPTSTSTREPAPEPVRRTEVSSGRAPVGGDSHHVAHPAVAHSGTLAARRGGGPAAQHLADNGADDCTWYLTGHGADHPQAPSTDRAAHPFADGAAHPFADCAAHYSGDSFVCRNVDSCARHIADNDAEPGTRYPTGHVADYSGAPSVDRVADRAADFFVHPAAEPAGDPYADRAGDPSLDRAARQTDDQDAHRAADIQPAEPLPCTNTAGTGLGQALVEALPTLAPLPCHNTAGPSLGQALAEALPTLAHRTTFGEARLGCTSSRDRTVTGAQQPAPSTSAPAHDRQPTHGMTAATRAPRTPTPRTPTPPRQQRSSPPRQLQGEPSRAHRSVTAGPAARAPHSSGATPHAPGATPHASGVPMPWRAAS